MGNTATTNGGDMQIQNTLKGVKLRNFTDEQKVEIKERVKQVKMEREIFMA